MTQVLTAAGVGISFLVGITYYLRKRINKRREIRNDLSLNSNLMKLIEQDQYEYYLLDVRSENEYRKGHIPTAINVPYGRLSAYLPSENLFSNMVVYGRSPLQSSRASSILSDSGYFNVTNFGPFFKWRGAVNRLENKKQNARKKISS
ncbi:MAG: hypothetical protein B6241_11190 [Spirochaetaceae bacterium 4572_59]|nr:MAG: hypothetical protein B6241_11190 [Spirochaetaceae bacterium 4572_59]